MKNFGVIIAVSLCMLATTSEAISFGRLMIASNPSDSLDLSQANVTLSGTPDLQAAAGQSQITLWEVPSGTYTVELLLPHNPVLRLDSVSIFPGVTTSLELSVDGSQMRLINRGSADLFGPALTLSSDDLDGIPGRFEDGPVAFLNTPFTSPNITSESVPFVTGGGERRWTAVDEAAPQLAVVTPGDANGNGSIDLAFDRGDRSTLAVQPSVASRGQNQYAGFVHQRWMEDRGSLLGSIRYRDFADAEPRANVDSKLPVNSLKNFDAALVSDFRFTDKLTADVTAFYTHNDCRHYLHEYYFDTEHSPREKGYAYRGVGSVYGWLDPKLFARISFSLFGDDSKYGDGVYFEDLPAYVPADGGGTVQSDIFGTFWAEGHVFDGYTRVKSNGWQIDGEIARTILPTTKVTLNASLTQTTWRQFISLYPTVPLPTDNINIGFDSLGNVSDTSDGLGKVPQPQEMKVGFRLDHVSTGLAARAKVEWVRFDAKYPALRDPTNPLNPDNLEWGDPRATTLDPQDLRDADAQSYVNLKLGARLPFKNGMSLFGVYQISHVQPSFDQLYLDYRYFEFKVRVGGSYYPFGNPALKPSRYSTVRAGVGYQHQGHHVEFAVQRRDLSDVSALWNMSAVPTSYQQWLTVNDGTDRSTIALQGSYQYSTDRPFTVAALFEVGRNGVLQSKPSWPGADNDSKVTHVMASGWFSWRPMKIQGNLPFDKLLRLTGWDLSVIYRTGIPYRRTQVTHEITMMYDFTTPTADLVKGPDFIELNAAVTARLIDHGPLRLGLRLEVLNILDRKNALRVYTGTGDPANTGWLNTPEGQQFIEQTSDPDETGLNGEQKYRLAEDNPNNFSRPRTIRLLATVQL